MSKTYTRSHYTYIVKKRCPKCMSGDIHKRVRHYGDAKIYRCYHCSNEFDSPFIGQKESKIGDKDGSKIGDGEELKTGE
jgi:ribosomal protein L37AE/L43A